MACVFFPAAIVATIYIAMCIDWAARRFHRELPALWTFHLTGFLLFPVPIYVSTWYYGLPWWIALPIHGAGIVCYVVMYRMGESEFGVLCAAVICVFVLWLVLVTTVDLIRRHRAAPGTSWDRSPGVGFDACARAPDPFAL